MMLLLAWMGENKVQLIHSISNLGGTRSQSKIKILGIIGMEQQGICVEIIAVCGNIICDYFNTNALLFHSNNPKDFNF